MTTITHGNIMVKLEPYGDGKPTQRWRPTVASGFIQVPKSTKGRKRPPKAIALLNNPTLQLAGAYNDPIKAEGLDRPLNTDYGHLVGLKIGGSDISGNVVPMYSHFNQGVWLTLEAMIAALKSTQKDAMHGVAAFAQYDDKNSEIPSRLRFAVLRANGKAYYDSGFLPNIPVGPKQVRPCDENALYLEKKLSEWRGDYVIEKENAFKNVKVPAQGILRPYAVLDALYLRGDLNKILTAWNIRSFGGFGNGLEFEEWQQRLIYLVNRIRNDGWLKSDQRGDGDCENLLDCQGDQGAQVDHIVSKRVASGSNAFSNAQVVSRRYNGKKNAKRVKPPQLSASAVGGSAPILVSSNQVETKQDTPDTEMTSVK